MICGSAIDSAPICAFGVPWDTIYVPPASWELYPNTLYCITNKWQPISLTPLYQVSSASQVSIMRAQCTEQVFLDRDNMTEWVIGQVDSITGVYTPLIDLSSTTRAVWCIGETLVDSSVDPAAIWWTDFVVDKELPDGTLFSGNVLRARAGSVPGLLGGDYPSTRIVLFDSESVDGVVVAANLHTTVYDPCV